MLQGEQAQELGLGLGLWGWAPLNLLPSCRSWVLDLLLVQIDPLLPDHLSLLQLGGRKVSTGETDLSLSSPRPGWGGERATVKGARVRRTGWHVTVFIYRPDK